MGNFIMGIIAAIITNMTKSKRISLGGGVSNMYGADWKCIQDFRWNLGEPRWMIAR
jgi:hypothetical protein